MVSIFEQIFEKESRILYIESKLRIQIIGLNSEKRTVRSINYCLFTESRAKFIKMIFFI